MKATCGFAAALAAAVLFSACGEETSPPPQVRQTHVSASGLIAPNGMVASGQRLASEASVRILESGGNAVDAAVATAFAIGVVDTGNAGLGGGGCMLIWMAGTGQAEFADFYSRAGSARGDSGSARNVAVPGMAQGLLEAHERFGNLPLEAVLAPAIRLAREGFAVPANLTASLMSHQKKIERHAPQEAVERFFPDGAPLQPGAWLVQAEKAAV